MWSYFCFFGGALTAHTHFIYDSLRAMPLHPAADAFYQPNTADFNTAYHRFHQSLHPTQYRHEGPSIDKEVEDLRRGFEALQRSFYRISQGMAFVRQQVNDSLAVVDVGVEGVANDVHNAKSAIVGVTQNLPRAPTTWWCCCSSTWPSGSSPATSSTRYGEP